MPDPTTTPLAATPPASLEDWQVWVGMAAFGVLGSLLNNRKRLTTKRDFAEAALLGLGSPLIVAVAYGLFGHMAVKSGIAFTPMLLSSLSGLLGAIGVQKRLDAIDKRVDGALDAIPILKTHEAKGEKADATTSQNPPPAP